MIIPRILPGLIGIGIVLIFITQSFSQDRCTAGASLKTISNGKSVLITGKNSVNRDIAYLSSVNQTPKPSNKPYKRAVLYNALGAVVSEVQIDRNDSVYVLDKVLKQNRSSGPLIIKMIR